MPVPKGTRPPNAGIGKKPGTPNKITRDLKEMVLAALEGAGGVAYLVRQASANPAAFLTLVGRIIPLQVTGKDGGAIQYQNIDAPVKETRDEWLARQMAPVQAANGKPGAVH